MIINNKEYKKYDDMYYVSCDGDVWSTYSNKHIKHYIDTDGYHRIDIHGKHIKIHKLVYLVWVGDIPNNLQLNHKDDNKDNNNYKNLYLGTQKENVNDCINNNHRKGNIQYLIVREKKTNRLLIFQPANKFIEYSGHSNESGSMKKMFSKQWFEKDYELVSMGKGVTTIKSDFSETVSKVG